MKTLVPLNSLVIVDGSVQLDAFPEHEVISTDFVEYDLFGRDSSKSGLEKIVLDETFRRIALKLSLGERVVLNGNLTNLQRSTLARTSLTQGASVYYLTEKHHDKFDDKLGIQIHEASPVIPFKNIEDIKNQYNGITVVGDIHGNISALEQAVSWAEGRNHFLWFLGDVIDYGPNSLEVLDAVYELVMTNKAAFIMGNHEKKIEKWFQYKEEDGKYRFRLSEGNRVTINAYNALPNYEKRVWAGKFKNLLARSSHISKIGNIVLTHGAVHPDYWISKKNSEIENYALYGEADEEYLPDFRLGHKWLDFVPKDMTVIVGHEIQSKLYPLVFSNDLGGKVVFLDTGCGKGGHLSSADILFDGVPSLNISNFNRHGGPGK